MLPHGHECSSYVWPALGLSTVLPLGMLADVVQVGQGTALRYDSRVGISGSFAAWVVGHVLGGAPTPRQDTTK